MRAVILTGYGAPDVLQVRELAKPVPSDDEVLIRIHSAAVTAGDGEVRGFHMAWPIWLPIRLAMAVRRLSGPLVLGTDLAGVVEAVGRNVTAFEVGDRVFGSTGLGLGTYAEYTCLPQDGGSGSLAKMPVGMSFEEAASVPLGGMMALQFLRKTQIQPGKRVLIIGAGGSIGTFAVQAAKMEGAHVTAVDSAGKLDMLHSIGADQTFDYQAAEYAHVDQTWDVIFSIAGEDSYARLMHLLNDSGMYTMANLRLSHLLRGIWTSVVSSRKVSLVVQNDTSADLRHLAQQIEQGRLRPVVDRSFPLDQAAEAHRYQDSGQKRGSIVLTVP